MNDRPADARPAPDQLPVLGVARRNPPKPRQNRLDRWDLDEILTLIAQKKYFLLHAPRQAGKTTCLLALANLLNLRGSIPRSLLRGRLFSEALAPNPSPTSGRGE